MNELTVVIITLNEARNIRRALESVQDIADEIIVMDSGSTDGTKAICEQFNVRFINCSWKGYAQTKNEGNDLSSHDWIFSLDADEAVNEKLKESIHSMKQEGFEGCYTINRLTNYCGKWIKHSGWYPDKKIRIFNRQTTKWTGEFVHETLEFSDGPANTELPGHLHHYSYYDYADHKARADKYSLLTAKKMNAAGKRAHFLKPYLSAAGRFFSMFILKMGFLDGQAGFKIAQISAKSNILKYKELIRLNKGQ